MSNGNKKKRRGKSKPPNKLQEKAYNIESAKGKENNMKHDTK